MKKKYILIMSSILVVLIILGVSYALLQKDMAGDNGKIIYQVGDLEVKLDETGSKDISLDNAIPTEDSDGMKNKPYSFSLVNNAVTDLKYTIYLEDDADAKNQCGSDCELIPYSFIRYNLSNDSNSLKIGNLSSPSTELYVGTIESKTTDKFGLRLWLSIDADNSAMGKYYFGKLKVVLSQEDDYCIRNGFTKLSDCMLVMNNHETSIEQAKQNIVAKGIPDFSKTAITDEGLFMAEDDEGPSYYYRGAVKNNYVSFAGFMWRIIRRNGDGSVRLIYSGKKTNDTGKSVTIGNSHYNDNYWDPTYIGYKYGDNFSLHESTEKMNYIWFTNNQKYNFGTGYIFDESTKKFSLTGNIQQLTWLDNHDEITKNGLYSCLNTDCNVVYKIVDYQSDTRMIVQPISYSSNSYLDTVNNSKSSTVKIKVDNWYKNNLLNYTKYLADSTFCNDRNKMNDSGYLLTATSTYASLYRLYSGRVPTLKCQNTKDKFKTTNVDATLEYPVALITADEASMAGGVFGISNNSYYLYSNDYFWTMSPSYFAENYSTALVWRVDYSGNLNPWYGVMGNHTVRPVINLKQDVEIVSGDGTSIAPFKIKTS